MVTALLIPHSSLLTLRSSLFTRHSSLLTLALSIFSLQSLSSTKQQPSAPTGKLTLRAGTKDKPEGDGGYTHNSAESQIRVAADLAFMLKVGDSFGVQGLGFRVYRLGFRV